MILQVSLILQTLKLNVIKAKIRKSAPKLYLENSALGTLCYSLNKKSETIIMKLLFQLFETRKIHALRN